MKPATHMRRGRTMVTLATEDMPMITDEYASLNLAKKSSHRIQMEQDRGLGLGSVVVVEPVNKSRSRRRRRRGKGGDK